MVYQCDPAGRTAAFNPNSLWRMPMTPSTTSALLAAVLLATISLANAQDILAPAPETIATVAAKVIKEKDSKDEVLKNAGQPTSIIPATADEGETWIYHAPPMTVFVEFDAWGVKLVTQRII